MSAPQSNNRPMPDPLLSAIADYALREAPFGPTAQETARYCLLDTLGCGILALQYPECTKLLGPTVPGATLANGARVPGTNWQLDPVTAAFNIGAMIRWLDFNDTWLAAEWGHPSDILGGILAVSDYLTRSGRRSLRMEDVLHAMIKAHEVQGVLALTNSFNRVGLDHVLLVRVATTAVVTALLGGTREQVMNAVSNAWADGGALRAYRHAPNTGSRKSWAAGDATRRGVQLGLIGLTGEMGYPSVLSAPTWGFQDVFFGGKTVGLERELDSYVMENVLFKVSFPAEFHAQTAVECAVTLHAEMKDRLGEVERVEITTHESAMRIIDKTGPLHNPADRDHCLQYMIAVGLIFGNLEADHYEDNVASDPRIDVLRDKMTVQEDTQYTQDYLDPDKRSIANRIQVFFSDGSSVGPVEVEYPIGHRRRRTEAYPLLVQKCEANLRTRYSGEALQKIVDAFADQPSLVAMPADAFTDLFATADNDFGATP